MRRLNQYITEKLKINNQTRLYNYFPKSKIELRKIITDLIKERGQEANLNDIDVSSITNMQLLFFESKFNGDISKWDVSNVKDMSEMFWGSEFNGDISEWNVSNVEKMNSMFYYSSFNGDISNWDVSKVKNMFNMFNGCPLEKNPPAWYEETN